MTILWKSGSLKEDLEYRLIRASMVIVFLFFGYTKWHLYAAETLMPFFENGPLISWMYPAFGVRGATRFLGGWEWLTCVLLYSGFWNKKLGILGAIGSIITFIGTITVIPFIPNGWAESGGGFPAMTGNVAFLMKDVVLLAASVYLLKQDVVRASLAAKGGESTAANFLINGLADYLTWLSLLKHDLDYHLLRGSIVIIFFFFGYQKWFEYEAQVLVPYISNGPLISWMYPVFGVRGASWFLGVSEWLFGALLLLGFWNKKMGILGAAGSVVTFVATVTIIPFMPNGWDAAAGGFPAMTGNVPFLMKDVVLLAVSIYLLKQDLARASRASGQRTWALAAREGSRIRDELRSGRREPESRSRNPAGTVNLRRHSASRVANFGVRRISPEGEGISSSTGWSHVLGHFRGPAKKRTVRRVPCSCQAPKANSGNDRRLR